MSLSDCYCDFEYSTVFHTIKRKARREHKCGECHGIIRKGEGYTRAGSLFDGSWSTFKRCGDCMVIACDMTKLAEQEKGCWCNIWEGMMGQMEEAARHADSDELAKLEPIFAAFNAASKQRGGRQIGMHYFEKDDEE